MAPTAYGLPCPPSLYLVGKKTILAGKKIILAHMVAENMASLSA
jgi:hypothetical protein